MEQIKVGDILVGMWHYTMHFPVWFRVTKVTAKSAKAVRLGSRMVQPTDGGYGQQGYEVPDENELWYDRGEATIRQGKRGLETGSYARHDHYNLEKWDGQPIWADHMD